MRSTLLLFLFLLPISLKGQFEFRYRTDIPVSENGALKTRAWEGGLNAAQFQTLDLNDDGTLDLVIYNRISRDIETYLNVNDSYIWSPQFAYQFPSDVVHWLILKDYDCDGLKDLFTSTALGIKVYKNTSAGGELSWEEAEPFLRFDAGTNIQVSPSDIPGIVDVNGDGALDILTYRFGTASSVDYFENTGVCGDLTFTRAERQWGGFEECDCDSFAFGGTACPTTNAANVPFDASDQEAIQHAGGKTILPFDADNDGDIDIISSDEFCETLYFLENVGDQNNAVMSSVLSYPINNPAAFSIFPSAFLADVNFDGLEDLLISTNADENIGNQIRLDNNIKVYSNIGSATVPDFDQVSTPFLQNEMIDLGENAYPAFVDLDSDGDQDLVVGNKGTLSGNTVQANMTFFNNEGNQFSPDFNLFDNDFLGFSAAEVSHLKPQFIDADGDGDQDLFYQATTNGNDTRIFYREASTASTFGLPIEIFSNSTLDDNPFFYDVNDDGDLDLLIGRRLGNLSLFINQGGFNFGTELPDFGGITTDFQGLNLWPHITDLNGDGVDEFITINSSGVLSIYNGPIDENFVANNPIENVLNINNETFSTGFGRQNSIASGDIFNTGRPALIIGSGKGGLYLLENLSTGGNGGDDIQVAVSPNPTSDRISVITNVNGVAEVYNILGQKKFFNINIQSGQAKSLDLSSLSIGIYILRIVSSENQSTTKKILVYR
ncbi:T9SS type A sorting domain-containing protein [Roseivirga sp.]|uniref:T9SS type A sorting domain-containing protein n=1 Tax=Roseivirga sp. TaxID=1964215 RepID=UPI003B8C3A43